MDEPHKHDWQPLDVDLPDGIAVCRCSNEVIMWRGVRVGRWGEGRRPEAPGQYVRETYGSGGFVWIEGLSEAQI